MTETQTCPDVEEPTEHLFDIRQVMDTRLILKCVCGRYNIQWNGKNFVFIEIGRSSFKDSNHGS